MITNTKHNAPIELTVLDQVPVSEDERLKIEITIPKGLKVGGEVLKTGASVSEPALTPAPTSTGLSSKGMAKSARASAYSTSSGLASGQELGSQGK